MMTTVEKSNTRSLVAKEAFSVADVKSEGAVKEMRNVIGSATLITIFKKVYPDTKGIDHRLIPFRKFVTRELKVNIVRESAIIEGFVGVAV